MGRAVMARVAWPSCTLGPQASCSGSSLCSGTACESPPPPLPHPARSPRRLPAFPDDFRVAVDPDRRHVLELVCWDQTTRSPSARLRRGRAPRPAHVPHRRSMPRARRGDYVPSSLSVHQRRAAQAVDDGGGEVPRRGGARVS
jgi:hypothetical protein